ncbi:TetR/AcrR family transcriptional regulator [Streptomyces sp. SID9727]|uniref:TetR/AcrR family transcriptional regulator n=1 Tax=Streptomyces sp. SID9727 TaxID=2706114 RepID=UPI0013C9E9A6|nr:TetR/AcrR family transcriptional regulator [Streptomyces sp. SID9727]NEC69840.1 TetR/AcrR family transcriptional regulator [Streptomyces sp. SID9727]
MNQGHPAHSLRERLIDAGVDLVMTEGSASLGLREIARRAGVSHGAPRRYFPTHHALLSAIARRGFTDLAARFAAAAEDAGTPRDQLRSLADAFLDYAAEYGGMFELMFRHDLLDSEAHASDADVPGPRLRESTLPLFARLVELVAQDRAHRTKHGTGPSYDSAPPPALTAAALWTNLHGIAVLRANGSLQLAFPGAAEGPDQLVAAALDAHLGRADA